MSNYVKQLYSDWHMQNWHIAPAEKKSCTTYRTYKHRPQIESYLTQLDRSDRHILSRYRCGNRIFPIHNNVTTDKQCSYCNNGASGDEYHYLMKCPAFGLQRAEFLPSKVCTNTNLNNFEKLMNTGEPEMQRILSKFCGFIMAHFEQFMA